MTELPDAFYRPAGAGRFLPTELTRGPWDPTAQHGGPPAALLGGAIAAFGDGGASFLSRITVELLRPVPLAAVEVEVSPLREGRLAGWVEARLHAEGKLRAVAHGVRIRREEVALPPSHTPRLPPPPGTPERGEELVFSFFRVEPAYHRGVEVRVAEGAWGEGPMKAWMRLARPLVEGRPTTPVERVLTLADAANGVAPALPSGYSFINPDLTVVWTRALEGEWLGLDARSRAEAHGVGVVEAALSGPDGEIGRSMQTLVVRRRSPAATPP